MKVLNSLIYLAYLETVQLHHLICTYFKNTESPMICYKYNKPIRNTILNFDKLVSDLDIETSSPDS